MTRLLLLVFLALTLVRRCDSSAEAHKTASISNAAFTVVTTKIDLGANFAMARPWKWRVSGLVGVHSKTVRRMQSASCGDKLFVAFTAHKSWSPNQEFPDQHLFDENTVGHIAEYNIDPSTGIATLVSDQAFGYCNEMGDVTVSTDCTIRAVLCRSSLEPNEIEGATDWMEATDPNRSHFGWYQTSIPLGQPKARTIDQAYILEWTGENAVASPPDNIVLISHSLGGWNYGHYALSLNAQKTTYSVDLKTTITSEGDTWHEGSTGFAIDRPLSPGVWNPELSSGWGCGAGHTMGNRLTYNAGLDKWARYCWADGCNELGKPSTFADGQGCFGTFFSTIPKNDPAQSRQLMCLKYGDPDGLFDPWRGSGGPANLVSRGADGFLAVAVRPDPSAPSKLTIGLAALPADQADCNNSPCGFKWLPASALGGDNFYYLDIPHDYYDNTPAEGNPIGFASVQHIGSGGEEGKRFLLGFADGVKFRGMSSNYYVVEADENGNLYGDVMPIDSGWGEEDEWAQTSSGCVVFPFTWSGDEGPGKAYGNINGDDDEGFSSIMHVTVICPNSDSQPKTFDMASFLTAGGNTITVEDGGNDSTGIIVGAIVGGAVVLIAATGIGARKWWMNRPVSERDFDAQPLSPPKVVVERSPVFKGQVSRVQSYV